MTTKNCGTCRHWKDWRFEAPWLPEGESYNPSDPPDDDDLGDCDALDPTTVPYSWRWAPREVTSTSRDDGSDCPCWAVRHQP